MADASESMGFIQFYGLTPCINVLEDSEIDIAKDDCEVNMLISETTDLRHVMKTLSDSLPLKEPRKHPVNIYLHEKNMECLGRDLLFLTILCETGMSKRER